MRRLPLEHHSCTANHSQSCRIGVFISNWKMFSRLVPSNWGGFHICAKRWESTYFDSWRFYVQCFWRVFFKFQKYAEGCTKFVGASGGNAGLALAYSAQKLDVPCQIFVPKTVLPRMKKRLASYGVTVTVRYVVKWKLRWWDEKKFLRE